MEKINWKKIGVIGVDAGMCWIGDPCYLVENPPFENWTKFCKNSLGLTKQFNFKAKHPGLGMVVSTGLGDGIYDVFAKTIQSPFNKKQKIIKEVKIVFVEDK